MPNRHASTGQNAAKSHIGDPAANFAVGDGRRLAVLPLDFEPIRVPYDPPHDVGDKKMQPNASKTLDTRDALCHNYGQEEVTVFDGQHESYTRRSQGKA